MKVILRQRRNAKQISLYLEYSNKGKRSYEYLKMYLTPEIEGKKLTRQQKAENKKTLQVAELIRSKRQIELMTNANGMPDRTKLEASFLDYFDRLTEKKYVSQGNYGNWKSVGKHLRMFAARDINFGEVTPEWITRFKAYIDSEAKTPAGKPLSQNSKYSYFNKLKAALNQAHKDQILPSNPSEHIKGFKQGDVQREILSIEELLTLAKTECELPRLKDAFIFSSLTGMRWSDIEKLVWSEVQHSESLGYYIRFRQQKTARTETLPISENAYRLLGKRMGNADKVFTGLKYSGWHNIKLQLWIQQAGINKKISFHCARHTYATLQLSAGTDIYTVSKLLGHRELSTTQVYTQVIDSKKKEAANKIQIEL